MAHGMLEDMVEPKDVPFKELLEMRRRLIEAMNLEKFAHETHVRPPRKLHFFRTVMKIEFRRKRLRKRPRPGMPGVNERAVNIEKDQTNHTGKYQTAVPAARFLRGRVCAGSPIRWLELGYWSFSGACELGAWSLFNVSG